MIVGAVLQLADTGMGSGYSVQVVGYPLAVPWQEGLGNAGTVGDTGFPWGPASIGDAVYAYREVTAVGPGTGSFASTIVATDGVSWNTPGGRGIGTDVIDCRLFGVRGLARLLRWSSQPRARRCFVLGRPEHWPTTA